MIKVLFVSFESLPFVKTGGLADVVYALPRAIDKSKYEVKVVLPLLKTIKDKYYNELEYQDHIYVNSGYINAIQQKSLFTVKLYRVMIQTLFVVVFSVFLKIQEYA